MGDMPSATRAPYLWFKSTTVTYKILKMTKTLLQKKKKKRKKKLCYYFITVINELKYNSKYL